MCYRYQRAKPIIVDPGLYMTKKADVFWVTQRRSVPTAFKLFTGTNLLRKSSFDWIVNGIGLNLSTSEQS